MVQIRSIQTKGEIMSIADTFDCPYHLKNHPCEDCIKEEEEMAAYTNEDLINDYLNR